MRYIENNNIIRIWLYKVLHSLDGKKLLKASETNTTGQKSQNIKVGTASDLLARFANKANESESNHLRAETQRDSR